MFTSIYKTHYEGMTYDTGVAYLRARSATDCRAPRHCGGKTLDEQREVIALAAREQQIIVVAEFIDYGDFRGIGRAMHALQGYCDATHPRNCIVYSQKILTQGRWEWQFWQRLFGFGSPNLIEAIDAWS